MSKMSILTRNCVKSVNFDTFSPENVDKSPVLILIRDFIVINQGCDTCHQYVTNLSLICPRVNTSAGGSGINEYVASLFDQSLTWEDVKWLKSITNLPIIVKGRPITGLFIG